MIERRWRVSRRTGTSARGEHTRRPAPCRNHRARLFPCKRSVTNVLSSPRPRMRWPARWFRTHDRSLLPGRQGRLSALTPGSVSCQAARACAPQRPVTRMGQSAQSHRHRWFRNQACRFGALPPRERSGHHEELTLRSAQARRASRGVLYGHPGNPYTCSRHQKHSAVFLSARSPPALSGAAP